MTTEARRRPLGRGLPTALAWPLLLLMLLVLGLASAVWNIIALLLYPLLPQRPGRRVGRTVIAWGYRLFWVVARASGLLRMDARVLQALANERGLIIVANHPSLLDAMMLVAQLPHSACVMKASLMRNPLLGPGARLARYIRNDSARTMIRQAVDDLGLGGQLLMFPEGTRTTRAPINPLQSSFAAIACRAGAPVQTVFIDTDSPYLGKGWPLWRLPPLPIEFSVRLGKRFEPGADFTSLVAEVEQYLAAGVRRLPHLP